MRTLVLAEHDAHTLKPQTLNAITCAQALGSVDVLVAGAACQTVAAEAAAIDPVDTVLLAESPGLEHGLAEALAPLLVQVADAYDALLAPATTQGKNVMPRVAALLDVQQISDICAVVDASTFQRPIYAGNAIETVQSLDSKKVITVRSTAFDAAQMGSHPAPIKTISAPEAQTLSTFVSTARSSSNHPELTTAKVVISGGRGMGSRENFALLETIANQLGGAVGASRAAVDAGFLSNAYQVGQTGKIVAPDLYIAVGISGAIQHVAGMKEARVIVAINSDPNAPIFQIADYGLVTDLFTALPELAQALEE